jgi:hypothetical protein
VSETTSRVAMETGILRNFTTGGVDHGKDPEACSGYVVVETAGQ